MCIYIYIKKEKNPENKPKYYRVIFTLTILNIKYKVIFILTIFILTILKDKM